MGGYKPPILGMTKNQGGGINHKIMNGKSKGNRIRAGGYKPQNQEWEKKGKLQGSGKKHKRGDKQSGGTKGLTKIFQDF